MSTTQASVNRHSRTGAWRTSMNSRKMMRTFTSAITITLDVISALDRSDPLAVWSIHKYANVNDARITQTTSSLLLNFTSHHVEQREDEHPEKVDGVPIGCAGFDQFLVSHLRSTELVDEDAEDDEADQQVDEVDPGEKEVVGEEVIAVEPISLVAQPGPLEHLDAEEHHSEQGGEERVPEGRSIRTGAGGLNATGH